MKIYLLLFILLSGAGLLKAQDEGKELTDVLAYKYCNELSKVDTVNKENFQDVLPKLDEQIIFSESGFLPLVFAEVKKRNISFRTFYSEVYNKFSGQCLSYHAIQGMDTTVELKDVNYFTESYCDCFNVETGGEIESNDLSSVLKSCNEKLSNDKTYKKKVRKELKNKELTRREFSEYITAAFLTNCDLIVDHFFSIQSKYLALNSELMLKRKETE